MSKFLKFYFNLPKIRVKVLTLTHFQCFASAAEQKIAAAAKQLQLLEMHIPLFGDAHTIMLCALKGNRRFLHFACENPKNFLRPAAEKSRTPPFGGGPGRVRDMVRDFLLMVRDMVRDFVPDPPDPDIGHYAIG